MAVASGPVKIARTGLALVGADANIESLDEARPEAAIAKLFYDTLRKQLLTEFDWAFARRSELLALSTHPPTNEWVFRYIAPPDMLVARRLESPFGGRADLPAMEVSGTGDEINILTNVDKARLFYTADVTNTSIFPANFTHSFEYLMAHTFARSLVKDRMLASDMFEQHLYYRDRAEAVDVNQEIEREEQDAAWVRGR